MTLSTEQKTLIRERVIEVNNAPRVRNVNFSIKVGTVVPRSVRVVPVPDVIVEIHPAWRGFLYFILDDEITIVDASTHKIVAVLDV